MHTLKQNRVLQTFADGPDVVLDPSSKLLGC
jgi:hypothetical protein